MRLLLVCLAGLTVFILGCKTLPRTTAAENVENSRFEGNITEAEVNVEVNLEGNVTEENFAVNTQEAQEPVNVSEGLDVPLDVPPVHEPEKVSAPEKRISQEMYNEVLSEVKVFIDHLNTVIGNKDYNGWKKFLSSEYFARISSREFLAEQSDTPLLKIRKIVLRSANDYFLTVVVPSRANSQVDEIEISDDDTVKVFHVDTSRPETRRLRLYELRKIENNWIITG